MTRLFMHGPVPDHLGPLHDTDPRRIGPYRIAGVLGAGGMGTVYAAADEVGACVAVKLLHPEYATDAEFRVRFWREVHLSTRVYGAYTASVLDSDTASARPWLATQYIPGPTLQAHLRDHGPLTAGTLAAFAAGTAEALHAVHSAGIVHRDLKPGNIILAPEGPKVLDFGIARAAEESAITRTGGVIGTAGWIAPELLNRQNPTPAADLFSWGALVVYAATGRNPFGAGTADAVIHRTQTEEPDVAGVGEWILPVVRAALNKRPEHRPSAAEILAQVDARWHRRAPTRLPAEPAGVATRLVDAEWAPKAAPAVRHRAWSPPAILAIAVVALCLVPLAGVTAYAIADEDRSSGPPGTGDDAAATPEPDGSGAPGPSTAVQTQTADRDGVLTAYGAVHGDNTFVTNSIVVQLHELSQTSDGLLVTGIRTPRYYTEAPTSPSSPIIPELSAGSEGDEVPAQLDGAYGDWPMGTQAPDEAGTFTALFADAPDQGRIVYTLEIDRVDDSGPTTEISTEPYGELHLCYDVDAGFWAEEECRH